MEGPGGFVSSTVSEDPARIWRACYYRGPGSAADLGPTALDQSRVVILSWRRYGIKHLALGCSCYDGNMVEEAVYFLGKDNPEPKGV